MPPLARLLQLPWTLVLLHTLLLSHVESLQCYGCNVLQGGRYVDVGCSAPVVVTCSLSHQGFRHRFCIRTESKALGVALTRGCATSRHCQQRELPGVAIHCCPSDLCNSAPCWRPTALHWLSSAAAVLLTLGAGLGLLG